MCGSLLYKKLLDVRSLVFCLYRRCYGGMIYPQILGVIDVSSEFFTPIPRIFLYDRFEEELFRLGWMMLAGLLEKVLTAGWTFENGHVYSPSFFILYL